MAKIIVEVKGLEKLNAALRQFPDIAHGEIERAMEATVQHLAGIASEYPPKPPQSEYRRTVTLGRSITGRMEVRPEEVLGFVGTKVQYAPFVIGPRQRDFHKRTGWRKLEDVVTDNLDFVETTMEQAAERIVQRIEETAT